MGRTQHPEKPQGEDGASTARPAPDAGEDTEGHALVKDDFHRPPATTRQREGVEWTGGGQRRQPRAAERNRRER